MFVCGFVFVFIVFFLFVIDDDNLNDDEKQDGCNKDNGVIGLCLCL